MMLFVKKNLSFLPFSRPFSDKNPIFSLFFFSSASETKNPPPKSHFMVEYLKTSFGFSSDKATQVSKRVSHLTSTNKPDSVLQFLKLHSFTDAEIRTIVSGSPTILCANVNKTLEPNLRSLLELDFTGPEIKQIIASNPQSLHNSGAARRFGFWKTLLNNNKKHLMMALTRNRGLIFQDIAKSINPKIAFLKERGLSDADIRAIIIRGQRIITRNIPSLEALLKRAEALGFSPNSSMFRQGLSSLGSIGSVRFKAKMELFRSFGWSDEEFRAALKKAPYFIQFTEEKIREKMDFLVGRAGCKQSYIASHPLLLCFSLEKRLLPRHHVMTILKSNGLIGKERGLNSIMTITEKQFVERFILRYKVEAATLHETYPASHARNFPL